MLVSVTLKNYKAIEALELPLEPLTVFVGPNGAGKTSVLEAIYQAALGSEAGIEGRASALLRSGSAGPLEISLGLDKAPGPPGLVLRSKADRVCSVRIDYEISPQGTVHRSSMTFNGSQDALNSAVFARLSPRQLAAASYSDEEEPILKADGTGLASVLADLAASQPERLAEIVAHMRTVIPALRRVRTQRTRLPEEVQQIHTIDGQRVQVQKTIERLGHRVLVDMVNGDGIPIEHISEGTVLLLGLFTLLCGRQRPTLLLLDDLDRALHPKAQADLVGALRKLQEARPSLQILATTHSPYLLDELRFEEVRVLTTRPDGAVVGGRLTEHPEFARWRDCVRPGELWTARLESWLAERPAIVP